MFSLKFFQDLPLKVGEEFQQLVSGVNAFLEKEHKIDGTHGNITTDSVRLGGGLIGEWTEVPLDQSRFSDDSIDVTWTIIPDDSYMQYCLCGSLAIVQFSIDGTISSVSADKATDLYINVPEINVHRYRKNGGIIIYNNLGAANNNTDGHFPIDILSVYGNSFSTLRLQINRFNSIERGGASVQYGNWRNEFTTIYGQIAIRTTANNEFLQYQPL